MSDRAGAPSAGSNVALAGLLLVLLLPALLVWCWGGVAGALFGASWPDTGGAELARVVVRLPSHLSDPRLAWPKDVRAELPGPVGFYVALAILVGFAALAVAGIVVWRQIRRDSGRSRLDKDGARWATGHDLEVLSARRRASRDVPTDDGVGRLALGWQRRRLVRSEERHALVVFGPPQSGKSAGLAAGALLEWTGPAIASSIKTDLLQVTIARRAQLGRVFVFDPFGLSGEPRSTWSPLSGVASFDDAIEVAQRLAAAGELDQKTVESGDFWAVAAEQRLAPLLYAAERTGKGVRGLVRWGYGQGEQELSDALESLLRSAETADERRDAQAAYDAAAAFRAQPDRTRGSIEGTVQALLRAYRFNTVEQSAWGDEITPDALLAGSNTVFLVGDAKASRLLRPIFLSLLGELVDEAYRRANLNGGRLDTSLLLCLDELGNIAPLPNLSEIASTAPSHNIQLISVFHDLAQARARYGRQAETVINSHRARMLLPGVADLDTLQYFSGLLGDRIAREHTRTSGPGYQARSETQARRPLAPPERLRQLPDGHALLIYGRLPPAILRLRMWFADRQLSRLAADT